VLPPCLPFVAPRVPMPLPKSDTDRSLVRHVEALYALARVLAGADRASTITRTVYEHAAEVPPPQRPSDERTWLFRLLVEAHEGDLQRSGAAVPPDGDTTFSDDPFRHEVAAETAERRLPVAFAACSIHERFILAIDVLGDPSDEVLAAALDTSTTNARSIRDQARSSLRASLRDLLRGPERMLVDVALPDEVLRDHLHELLVDRFHPAPASLQSSAIEILERAREERRDDPATGTNWPSGAAFVRKLWTRLLNTIRDNLSLGGLIGGITFVVVVTASIGGAAYFFSGSSPPPPSSRSIVDLSVQRAAEVEVTQQTENARRASAFIQTEWERRVSVPDIEGASLQGVGLLSLSMGTDVPALLYADDETESQIVALVFNYALLNQLGKAATLAQNYRSKLATNESLLTEQRSDRGVVLWRQRDDIFVAVAPNLRADTLRARIRL
jgi:DNA-directed RNA polymerase specialized sigma24 family protein